MSKINKFRLLATVYDSDSNSDPTHPSGNFIHNHDISTFPKDKIHEFVTHLISLGIYAEINRFDNNLSIYGTQDEQNLAIQEASKFNITLGGLS